MFSIKFEVEVDFLFMQTFEFGCLFLNFQLNFHSAWTERNLFLPDFLRASAITIPDSRGSRFSTFLEHGKVRGFREFKLRFFIQKFSYVVKF